MKVIEFRFKGQIRVNILGIVTKSHDTGIALLKDGVPQFVYEEERFNREKHTLAFPDLSLAAAIGEGKLDMADVDVMTTPWDMSRLRPTFFKAVTGQIPASLNLLWPSANRAQARAIVNLPMRLRLGLGKRFGRRNVPPLVQVSHHDAHAAVFFVSPFEEAAVLVMDGYGDDTATSASIGSGNRLERLWQDDFFDSIGMLYSCVTEHLGFKVFEEGTVMALAALGSPKYAAKFADIIRLLPDGKLAINRDYVSFDTHGFNRMFKQPFYDAFGPPRMRGSELTERQFDLAYALQHTVEEAILHVVREMSRRHPSRNLVMSGGVALNCVANARILRDTDYKALWVPPIASDAGAVVGSALFHHHQTLGNPRGFKLTHPFYGKGYRDGEIEAALKNAGLSYRRMGEDELLSRVADDLAAEKIVGWFQGRAEIGPRALGNRSILSGARSLAMKDLINARIKHRESFRPFAPAVLEERLSEFFEFNQPDPFMTMAPRVRPDKVGLIPAAVHVDGTGRIQTVSRAENPRYYGVIERYAALTGVPVILNTSFNRQEPVVNSPDHAVSCYLRTDMDVLVIGDFYTTDRNAAAVALARDRFGAEAK